MNRNDCISLLEATAYDLWMAVLRGGDDVCVAAFKRMNDPKVGDWVMEITSYRIIKYDRGGFGKLESVEMVDGQKVWTIFSIPEGRLVKWRNGEFIALLNGYDWYPRMQNK